MKLSRYEATTKRQPYWTRHEQERRQPARRGAALTPPQVIDLEVSGMFEETRHQDKRFSRMMLCVAKITKQSQTADCSVFPRCCISGCSDGTGRQHTSSRLEVRWLASAYRSAYEPTTKSRGACSAARSASPTRDAIQQPLGVNSRGAGKLIG